MDIDFQGIKHNEWPDPSKPLPPMYYGYYPGRCDTVVDPPGAPTACVVTPEMDANNPMVHPELKTQAQKDEL